jgi:diguanylate cyclase (GGDEF)-like protein
MDTDRNGDGERPVAEQTLGDADQTAADADQTAADLDQTGSDSDQSLADREQHQADVDQAASDRDQAAATREASAQPNSSESFKDAYDVSRDDRDAGTLARDLTTLARTDIADARHELAAGRDHNAHLRDLTAKARDLAAEALDRAAVEEAKGQDARVAQGDQALHNAALGYVAAVREDAAKVRRRAAVDRAAAAKDRVRAAGDREEAAREGRQAQAELQRAHLDGLTGAYLRGIGLVALQQEIERARRGDGSLVLAFVDVDHLKKLNDRDGHAAGDALLRAVATTMRSKMRSYEPIVRFGGDEFVCALPSMDLGSAQTRLEEIQGALARDQDSGTISFGLAALDPGDSLDDLMGRADAALAKGRALR